jgi:hypothetical protein
VPAIFPQPFLFHLLLSLPCCPTVFQYLTDWSCSGLSCRPVSFQF